jgi:hypothetical protein
LILPLLMSTFTLVQQLPPQVLMAKGPMWSQAQE